MFSTFIKGETSFPEFGAVFKLDDIQFAYYNSKEKNVVHRGVNGPERTPDATDLKYVKQIVENSYLDMREAAFSLSHNLSHTNSE